MRKKTTRIINPEEIVVSWDADKGLISFGLRNDSIPTFLCRDEKATKVDFERIKYISFYDYKTNRTNVAELTSK